MVCRAISQEELIYGTTNSLRERFRRLAGGFDNFGKLTYARIKGGTVEFSQI